LFDNKHRRRMGRGIWSRFDKQERNADNAGRPIRLHAELQCDARRDGLFHCHFCALLMLVRQMLDARIQHLPQCLKKLDS